MIHNESNFETWYTELSITSIDILLERRRDLNKILLLIAFISCNIAFGQTKRTIEFQLPNTQTDVTLEVFRFYITNVSVTYSDGTEFAPKPSYFLIDIENKSSLSIPLDTISNKEVSELTFTIGTDSSLNVAGIFDGVLDPIQGMYWAWNTGYINFKIEGNSTNSPFEYHIGGYLPPYSTAQNISFKLSGNPKRIPIAIDLETFIRSALTKKTSVLIPGSDAQELSKQFKNVFRHVQ